MAFRLEAYLKPQYQLGTAAAFSLDAYLKIAFSFAGGVTDHPVVASPILMGAPVLASPLVNTNYALTASPILLGAPVLASPVLSTNYALIANAILMGIPELASPTGAEQINYSLLANAILMGAPILESPLLTTNYGLIANAILIGVPELGSPLLESGFLLAGVTRDGVGSPLGSCVVQLFRTSDDAIIQEKTSEADGSFYFYVTNGSTQYYIVAYKAGSPDRAGTTLNTLVGV